MTFFDVIRRLFWRLSHRGRADLGSNRAPLISHAEFFRESLKDFGGIALCREIRDVDVRDAGEFAIRFAGRPAHDLDAVEKPSLPANSKTSSSVRSVQNGGDETQVS
jgi:hypothetical protein